MRTVMTNKIRIVSAFTLCTVLCAGAMVYPGTRRSGSAAPASPDLKVASQVKNEAALYETAMREIGQLANSSLATVGNLKKAIAVLERQIPNLRYNRSKLARASAR